MRAPPLRFVRPAAVMKVLASSRLLFSPPRCPPPSALHVLTFRSGTDPPDASLSACPGLLFFSLFSAGLCSLQFGFGPVFLPRP